MSKTAHSYSSKDRTSDVLNDENLNIDFASLLLSSDVLTGLSLAGFERPSPIQLKAIPLGRCGLDLIVQAKSGTGKTCVFSVIILESLDLQCGNVQALVLTPTREIATQVHGVIQSIGGAMHGMRCHTFIGGTLYGPDRQKLKKCHIAVGTPGRVKQLIEYDAMATDSIRLFILDEADKLLEAKFQEQINWIYNHLPVNKQMLALSATYPEALARGLTSYMRDPMFVRLNPRNVALKGIKQFYKVVPGHGLYHKAFEIKVQHLLKLFTQVSFSQCLVFSNLSSRAQNLSDILCERGWPSTCISGNQDQTQRHSAMSMLKTFQCRVLISTDLTARGIDAENVNLIVNLDVPFDGKTYMHRIGRAGRFGSKGVAVTLASEGNEETLLRNIQRQCHVKLYALPDPVPSDLVNSIDVSLDSSDDDGESSSPLECDDSALDQKSNDGDEDVEIEEPGMVAKTLFTDAGNASSINKKFREVPQGILCAGDARAHQRSNQRSNHRSQVNQGGNSVSHVNYKTLTSVTDKSCQVDTVSMPFNICSPIDFKIPSLAEKVSLRRQEDRWTWQKAVEDFEKFMSGYSESMGGHSHPQPEGCKDVVDENTEISQSLEKSSEFAGHTEEHTDSLRTVQEVENTGSSLRAIHLLDIQTHEQPSSEGVEINVCENVSVDDELRSDPNNCCNGIVSVSHDEVIDEKVESSNDETEKSAADVSSRDSVVSDDVITITPVMPPSKKERGEGVADRDIKKTGAMGNNDTDKESDVESNERYKVGLSWRPSQDYFDNVLIGDITGLLITESSQSDCALETNTTDAQGARPKDSVPGWTDDGTDEVNNIDLWRPVSVKPKDVTRGSNRQSKVTKGRTSMEQSRAEMASSEKTKFQSNRKSKSSTAKSKWQLPETSSSSTKDLLQANAVASNRLPSEEISPPGSDPIWQYYTDYLPTHEDARSDTDGSSYNASDDSDSDIISTSENQEGSESFSEKFHTSCETTDPQKPNPDSRYAFSAQHYGVDARPPLPYNELPTLPTGYYGAPDCIPTATMSSLNPNSHDNSTQFGLNYYSEDLYSGQYWPYAYY